MCRPTEALEASGFRVELRVTRTRSPQDGGTSGEVLVTGGTARSIKKLVAELEKLVGVAPVLSNGTESTLVTLSRRPGP